MVVNHVMSVGVTRKRTYRLRIVVGKKVFPLCLGFSVGFDPENGLGYFWS